MIKENLRAVDVAWRVRKDERILASVGLSDSSELEHSKGSGLNDLERCRFCPGEEPFLKCWWVLSSQSRLTSSPHVVGQN